MHRNIEYEAKCLFRKTKTIMKKLIFMIPTGGKSLEEMNKAVGSAWPEISERLNLERPSKQWLTDTKHTLPRKAKTNP